MIKGIDFGSLYYLPYCILFIIILLNLASNKSSIISLDNKLFNYMGKISYGIYMLHQIAISLSIQLIRTYYVPYTGMLSKDALYFSTNVILYSLVMVIVTVMSMISYNYFEKYFLAKKMQFSTIISGDSVDVGCNHQSYLTSVIAEPSQDSAPEEA